MASFTVCRIDSSTRLARPNMKVGDGGATRTTHRLKCAMDSPGMMRNWVCWVCFPPPVSPSPVPLCFRRFRDGPAPSSSEPFLFFSAHSCRTLAAFNTRLTLLGISSFSMAFFAPGATSLPLLSAQESDVSESLPDVWSLHTILCVFVHARSASHVCGAW